MEDGDAVVVAKVRAGDQDAFGVLVERHSAALFRLIFRMTGNEQDAEDTVQETFLRAYRQLNRFESRANFSTWLHRIAANCSLDLLRKRTRQGQRFESLEMISGEALLTLHSSTSTPDRAILNTEIQHKVESALDQLTPMERTAFVLRHFENNSIEEIGSALNLGQSAAKQAIFRAVQKVRRSLEPLLNSVK